MKTALITGASQGIGAAVADKLNDKKIKVILVSRSKSKLKSFQKNLKFPKNRDDAYKALNLFYEELDKKTVGWKIGAVAKEVQKEEGFDGPVPGKIFKETILPSNCSIKYSEIPYSNLECEYAFEIDQDVKIDGELLNKMNNFKLYTAIDITSSRYLQSSKNKFDKLVQMYLGISDHGNGGKIIIGEEIKNWHTTAINKIKIKLKINDNVTEPYFTGTKRIDPRDSLKAFVDEFKDKNISFKKGDYLLCGSLTQPYKINMKDKIIVTYENLRDINIKIL